MKKTHRSRKAKSAPLALIEQARGRTNTSLNKIEEGKNIIERKLQNGELASWVRSLGKETVERVDFMRLCGLGSNFLNGPNHKKTTKAEVNLFLENINECLQMSERIAEDESSPNEKENWKEKYKKLEALYQRSQDTIEHAERSYSRLATHAHHWHLTLRQALRENRILKAKTGIKVVPIPR